MEIILGKTAGFCYGVERAVKEAKKYINKNEDIYSLGELVNNQSVIKELEEKGIKFIEDINDAKGKIIIRAHGTTKETYQELSKKGIEIKDLTCPNVLRTHTIAEEYSQKGYFIILIGIKKHPEVIGTLSFCGNSFFLIQEEEDIEELLKQINKTKINNILIMAQTTYNSKKFDNIVDILKEKLEDKNIKIQKTICGATEIRQKETIEIAKKVEVMIIIGDKKSSNTNKLYDISKENCTKTLFIQNEKELDTKELGKIETIGIMASASTPKEDIDRVITKLRSDKNC